ncbi:MAG: phosphonate ABC transporter, permease protein PhnE, partial [Paracoccaceae bacterium]
MAISTKDGLKVWQRRDRDAQLKIWAMWLVGTAIFVWSWTQISAVTTWAFFWDAPRIAADIGGRSMPPRWAY